MPASKRASSAAAASGTGSAGSERHVLVDGIAKARDALKTINKSVKRSKVVAVDIEGDLRWNGRLSLIQIGLEDESVFLFDVQECPSLLEADAGLRSLLCGPVTKILHDCRNDARALKGQFDIVLTHVWDTQVAHSILTGKDHTVHLAGLNVILQKYAGAHNEDKKQVKHGPGVWEQRPLPALLLRYAARDVQHLVKVYRKMHQAMLQKNLLQNFTTATSERLAFNFGFNFGAYARVGKPCILAQSASGSVNPEVKKSLRELLAHTADAFWRHVMSLHSHRELEDRDRFTKAFQEWKRLEASEGREWRGGPGSVLFELVRKKAIKQVKSSSTIVFGSSGGVSAAFARVVASRERIAENKHGIEVSDVEFDQAVCTGATCSRMIQVHNFAPQERWLDSFQMLNNKEFSASLQDGSVPMQLAQNSTMTLVVKFKPASVGVTKDTLSLVFTGAASLGKFTIGRFFEAQCGDADLLDDIRPSAPFAGNRKAKSIRFSGKEIIQPPLPEDLVVPRYPRQGPKLNQHHIPSEWRQVHMLGEEADKLEEACRALEDACTAFHASSISNIGAIQKAYIHLHQRLLWSEEIQLERDLAHFNLTGDMATKFAPDGRHLRLSVAGLAEKRPSLLKGDFLNAWLCHDRDRVYKGRVEWVEREDLLLRFDKRLHDVYITGQRVEIQFILNRGPWRLFHQGLEKENVTEVLVNNVLFPSKPPSEGIVTWKLLQRSPFNRLVRDNPQQWRAVSCIVDRSHQPCPFVVFGPPGTGKTTTLVEAILQFVVKQPSLRVLVCAPTNTAADLLCSRLTQTSPSEMLRLMAFSRNPSEVDRRVLPYTNQENGQFVEPQLSTIEQKKIVVATLATASRLFNIGVRPGHFDLIVIDEAGQAMEPEIVAVLAPLQIPQVVLGGDPRQLGPVIHSPAAKKHGLSTSMLERLLSRAMYSKSTKGEHADFNGYDAQYITMLVCNYRSHALLLKEPNDLFYDGSLECCANPMITDCRLQWEGLPKEGVPLLWHGIQGKEEREANSPSWFNRDEAVCVLQHVRSLMRMRPDCKQENIGIITPYNKQAHKIKRLLIGEDLKDIKVGSTEMFQGQERQIIIISTVRSSLEMLSFDIKHKIGFLDNPKRFNVAVTRPSSLLIIVGNPNVFVRDPHWGKILRLCQDLGAYKGIAVQGPEDMDESNTLAAQNALQDLLLDGDPDDATPEMRQGTIAMPEFDS